jgi:hypothetical protein
MRWISNLALVLPALLSFSLISPSKAASKNFIERTFESQSKDKNPVSARQEMINYATEKVSEELIKEIIGDSKYSRNKTLITQKILKNSARFIPFSRPGDLQPLTPEGFKMSVTLRINVDDLQSMLLANGLFYESDSTPVVLPAIRFNDRIHGKNYGWWKISATSTTDLAAQSFLIKESRSLEQELKDSFLKHNFYLLKPQNFRFGEMLPSALTSENLRTEDWQFLAQKMGAPILLEGEVTFSKSLERSEAVQISLRMTASQVMNSRVIAEVTRQFETDSGAFEVVVARKLKEMNESVSQDLSAQVLEAWQKGALGASLFRLTIQGRIPLLQQEAFKEALKTKVREVKSVRERLISADSLVFEVDSAIGAKELAQKAPRIEMPGLNLVIESSNESEAVYRVSK